MSINLAEVDLRLKNILNSFFYLGRKTGTLRLGLLVHLLVLTLLMGYLNKINKIEK